MKLDNKKREGSLMNTLFNNIENKLKVYAKISLVCGVVVSIIFLLLVLMNHNPYNPDFTWYSIFALLAWLILVLISSWGIYAFAEILESVKSIKQSMEETNYTLKLGYAQDIKNDNIRREKEQKAAAEKAKIEQERIMLAEQERKEKEEQIKKENEEKARRIAKDKQDRIDAYWEKNIEEKKALISKKQNAEEKLKKISSLATEERKQLQHLIDAIEEELTKDREV